MSFGTYLANGFKAFVFNKQAVADIRDDPASFTYALIINAVISILVGLAFFAGAALISRLSGSAPDPIVYAVFTGLGIAVAIFCVTFLSAGLINLLAKLFGGIATIQQYYGVYTAIVFVGCIVNIPVSLLGMIPVFGQLLSLAFIVFYIGLHTFIVRENYSLSTGKAVFVVLIPVLVIIILAILVIGYFDVLF